MKTTKKPSYNKLTIYLDPVITKRLKVICAEDGIAMSARIERLLEAYKPMKLRFVEEEEKEECYWAVDK